MSSTRVRLHSGQLIALDGLHHQIIAVEDAGIVLRTFGQMPATRTLSHADVAEVYFQGQDRFKIIPNTAPPNVDEGVLRNLERDPGTFSAKQEAEASRREEFVLAFRDAVLAGEAKRTKAGYAEYAARIAIQRRAVEAENRGLQPEAIGLDLISGRSLKRWYSVWMKTDQSRSTLMPRHDDKGPRGNRIHPEVEMIIARRIQEDWLILEKPPLDQVAGLIMGEIDEINKNRFPKLPQVCERTIRRWVDKNVSQFEKVCRRESEKEAEQQFREGRLARRPMRPLEEVEIDHTPFDVLIVLKDGTPKRGDRRKKTVRAYLTVAICRCTRMIVGYHISLDQPCWTSVMSALRMAVLPKDVSSLPEGSEWPPFGLPEAVHLDNAREFHSHSMRAAAGQLRIRLKYMPRGKARMKGTVERLMLKIAKDFHAFLPGKTFRNVQERGDYPSEARAALTLPALEHMFRLWVVNVYHLAEQSALLKKSPLQKWKEFAHFGVRLPPKAEDLEPLIGLVVQRTIRTNGIFFLGLVYQSTKLSTMRRRTSFHYGREYLVKADHSDISYLLVLDEDQREWIEVPCVSPELTTETSLNEWKDTVELARTSAEAGQRVTLGMLRKSREIIREETRRLGARASRSRKFDGSWFREISHDPIFDIEAFEEGETPSDTPDISELQMRNACSWQIARQSAEELTPILDPERWIESPSEKTRFAGAITDKRLTPIRSIDRDDPKNWK